jgi:eukaryotic-like serine/threonine-protein kinase
MRPATPIEDSDPERTRVEEDAPKTALVAGGLGRGSVLAGKYRLEMLLGEGGMACVWSAYHLELELPVAIKLLRAGPKNERLAKRLRLEARAAARLVHPSIVRVFDVAVTDGGDPFIVMELLTGESLAAVIARERLSSVRAVQLLLPIAEALAVAHAKGIVHRDLKPDNVFLSKDAQELQPKLLDFGIAKLEHAARVKLTDKGTVLGSPSYMSPEQVRGDDVDYRSDIWSFCVVLYKAVAGMLPFKGANTRATMNAILESEPAPLPAFDNVDATLLRLILWGLSKDPARRPRCMRELGTQLAQWLLTQGVSEDACGAPLATKWLPRMAELGLPRSAAPAVEIVKVRNAKRVARSRHRRWALLPAAAISLVIGVLACADSAPDLSAPVATSVSLVLAPSPAARPQAQVLPAVFSTVAAPAPRVIKPKANPPRRAVPAPQLPF